MCLAFIFALVQVSICITFLKAVFNTDKLANTIFLIQVAMLDHQNLKLALLNHANSAKILLNNGHVSLTECLLAELALT